LPTRDPQDLNNNCFRPVNNDGPRVLQDRNMPRRAFATLLLVAFAGTATADPFWGVSTHTPAATATAKAAPVIRKSDESVLPRPASLQPAVGFWTKVYTEADTSSGYVHDDRYLDVVYAVVRFRDGASRRTRQRAVKDTKKRYATILRALAGGKRSGLDDDETRVLALWADKEDKLKGAAERLRFQLGQANRFKEGLVRSGAWTPYIFEAVSGGGLPTELVALPHVESSFNPGARSHVGAAGMWQFTRSTGRRFMRIDHVVDERLDPFLSTNAAVQLLQNNYEVTGTWPLAITAYNHGAAGMRRASNQLGTTDIGVIVQSYRGRTFGFASRNFYAAFLAAVDADADAETYFGEVDRNQEIPYQVVELPAYLQAGTLSEALGLEPTTLRTYNPSLKESVWTGDKHVPKGFPLRAPVTQDALEQHLADIDPAERHSNQRPDEFHKIQRGESLSVIAAQYGVSVRQLVALNDLRSAHRIRAGQVLRLPIPAGEAKPRATVARAEPKAPPAAASTTAIAVTTPASEPAGAVPAAETLAVAPAAETPAAEAPPVPEAQASQAVAAQTLVAETASAEPVTETLLADVSEDDPDAQTALTLPPMDLSADPSNYAVAADGSIEIQPVETLGHYAEWLDIRASQLRRLNGMRYGTPVVVGRHLSLDFAKVDAAAFETRRRTFHRELQETFFARRHIMGTTEHVIRDGDSLWLLSEVTYEVPVWLLRQYNPDLDFNSLRPGKIIRVPIVAKTSSPAG
jgi:membrane-bound lytic murein transglycosylase D